MQNVTNEGTISAIWRKKKLRWGLEIIAELGEAIESTPHKWWKNGKLDLENLKVEIIDMLHFSLSFDMTNNPIETISHMVTEPTADLDGFEQNRFEDLAEEVVIVLGKAFGGDDVLVTQSIINLAWGVGMDTNEIRTRYIAKNALNLIRQQNGYKAGLYIKDWDGQEDNVWITNLIAKSPDLTFNDILNEAQAKFDTLD